MIYKIVAFYVNHFKFPYRGKKYFLSFLKKISRYHTTFKKKLHNGQMIFLNPSDHIQQMILWYGYYEKESILTWEHFIQTDSVIIDIGANIGYYTLIAAKKAANGWVHSFEPVTKNYEALQKNIHLNHLTNVTTNAAGISADESLETYYISSGDNSGMSGLRPAENFSGFTEKIKTITLDSYAETKKLSHIDIIKIDIEGNEMNALKGMKIILEKYSPVIFIELINEHLNNFSTDIAEVYAFLKSYDYKPYKIISPNILKPLNTATEGRVIIFMCK